MINKQGQPVEFRGTKKGLMIVLDGSCPFDQLLEIMHSKLQESDKFFQEGQVKVQVKNRRLNVSELNLLSRLFSEETNLELGEIISDSGEVLVSFPSTYQKELGTNEFVDYRINNSLVIRKTLRSGQKVEFPGSIIVIGNVNPGAELIAVGDIIVFGELKGTCHAGVDGDVEASIMALKLMANQLRIADIVSRAPDEFYQIPNQPERAFVSGNQIVVEDVEPKNLTDKM